MTCCVFHPKDSLVSSDPMIEKDNAQSEMKRGRDGPRALVVDDDESVLATSARSLASKGYRVEVAQDAAAALRAIRGTSFDVLLSDIHMPGMDGMELVARLRADGLDIPIVLLTGDPQLETAMTAIEHGVLRYLTKPVAPDVLVGAVNEVVRLHGIARAERMALDNAALRSLVDELRQSKDAALAGTRAKDEFLSKMGHELRTPMTAVIGMTELALDSELTPEQREYLETVKTSADSLMKLIVQMLTLSELAGGTLRLEARTFRVRDTITRIMHSLLSQATAKGLSLMSDVGSDVPDALVGDPVRFGQVVDSLLNNAIKFTAKGSVRINTHLEAHADDKEARVCVSISDTGIGIPADALARVTEAFSQGDNSPTRAYGGAGLGLTIASQLASLVKGSLRIESSPNLGTTVRFTACFGRVLAKDNFLVVDSHAL
jgi:signal transduction histidine kinase